MRTSTVCLVLVIIILACITAVRAQDPTPGKLVYEVDGQQLPVTSMVTNEQFREIFAALGVIDHKLDALLAQHNPVKDTPPAAVTVSINTATYDQLIKLPGIGPVKAGALIMARDTPTQVFFTSWEELQRRVSGFGPATIADLKAAGVTLD